MSFILDALRKSEHERQRQAGPAIAEIPVLRRPANRVSVAAVAIGALVLVNLGVLAYFLLRDRAPATMPMPTATPAPAPTPAPAAADVAAAPLPTTAAPPADAPPAAREVRPLTGEAVPDFDQPPPAQYEPPAPPDPSLLPPMRATTPPPRSAPSSGPFNDMVPTINDLAPQATAGLPELNLDLHVYATDPAQRFVFINNRRYHEGASTPEGVRVERITTDGVILNWHGVRFLLPRQ